MTLIATSLKHESGFDQVFGVWDKLLHGPESTPDQAKDKRPGCAEIRRHFKDSTGWTRASIQAVQKRTGPGDFLETLGFFKFSSQKICA